MQINANIRKARELKGYSQREFADLLGEKRSTYAEWERETVPKADILQKISAITGVNMDELLSVKTKNSPHEATSQMKSKEHTQLVDTSIFFQLMTERENRINELRTMYADAKSDKERLFAIVEGYLKDIHLSSNNHQQTLELVVRILRSGEHVLYESLDRIENQKPGSHAEVSDNYEIAQAKRDLILKKGKQGSAGKQGR